MNQILDTKINTDKHSNKKNSLNIILLRFQFIFSAVIVVVAISFALYYIYYLQNKEKLVDNILSSYNISKLYSNSNSEADKINTKESENSLFGTIEITKLNLYYPVFSYLTEDLLKISPCKFYGNTLKEPDNICIAGHNYNNSKFFSKLHLLEIKDEIYLYDINGNKYVYKVVDKYEVNSDDLSPIFNYNHSNKELTLITCNNLNSKRLIVKALQV